ncbi:hypothetical protein DL770_007841 [Monosporascus sp. CRB-9-2]|nr:hypothetical protein DL770_007841 [Monosporascus sp. CRB-9-2]
MMLPWTLSVGAALSALLAAVSAECDREALFKFADSYVFAQENGQAGYLENIADNFTYVENNKTQEITSGIFNNALVIDHRRTIADTTECATFTELIVTRNASGMPAPYVIGTQIRHSPGDMSCYLIDSIVTTEGNWLFNVTGTLYWVQRENWDTIPEAERDSRETLKSAADAYLSMWDNKSAIDAVPWGTPCARLEGGVYTGNGGPNDSCKVGIPTNNTQAPNSHRRYVIDETVGSISVLCIFEHLENAPDSHEFRLEKGKRHTSVFATLHAVKEPPYRVRNWELYRLYRRDEPDAEGTKESISHSAGETAKDNFENCIVQLRPKLASYD